MDEPTQQTANPTGSKPELSENERKLLADLQQHQDRISEVQRRQESAREPLPVVSPPTEDIVTAHKYDFAIICKANRGMSPPSDRPAFRVLGFFHEAPGTFDNWVDELRDSSAMTPDGGCKLGDLHKVPVLKYALISKTKDRDTSTNYVLSKINRVKGLHMDQVAAANLEFEEHRRNRGNPSPGEGAQSEAKTTGSKKQQRKKNTVSSRVPALKHHAGKEKGREVARVPRALEIKGQNFAVVVVLTDITPDAVHGRDDPEPIVMFIDAFDTCEEAEKFAQSLENHIFNVNVDVVDMYQWLFPEDVDYDQVCERYRHPEQNKIMQEKKNKKRELQEAEAKARREGKPLAGISVTEDSVAPADFRPLEHSPGEFSYKELNEPLPRKQLTEEELAAEAKDHHALGVHFPGPSHG